MMLGHENGLLGPTYWVRCVYMHHIIDRDWMAWQKRSARLGHQTMQGHENGLLGQCVESNVSICTILLIEIGWHDRRDQHGWVAQWYKVMKMGCWDQRVKSDVSICTILLIKIGQYDRRGKHGWVAKWRKAIKVGCWDQHVESNVSIYTILEIWIVEK